MLFPYKFVPHQMDKMQEFIDYIFYEVWCQAPWKKYSIDLFDNCPDLKEIIVVLCGKRPKSARFFIIGIRKIFNHFKILNHIDIRRMKKWYSINNNLDKICSNTRFFHPISYASLERLFRGKYKALNKELKKFFTNLYSDDFLSLKVLSKKINDINNHYNAFMTQNKSGKCPFCGIADMKGIYHSKREAYDHYLPKALYPFNSINFRNLVPACNTCNSSYKLSKDPTLPVKDPCKSNQRRRIFYPYAASLQPIEISINLRNSKVDSLKPEEIEIQFQSTGCNEEIGTWKEIYGIEERYKAKCCSESDGKYWLAQVLDEWKEDGRAPSDFLRALRRQTRISPFADNNFLKVAFLEACEKVGVFSNMTVSSNCSD